ncbi:hypothetical protein PVL29_016253 [Vitis rotundifolia]|nr:hypothetical protein PVL29_016253 [Vitis rotundifolia]
MNMVDRARHKRWIQDVLSINQRVGDVETLEKRRISEDASEIYSQLTILLDHSIDDIDAYVPRKLFEKMCKKTPEVETTTTVHGEIGIPSGSEIEQGEKSAVCHQKIIPVPKEILDMAAGFATDQIFQNIQNPQIMRIGISGRDPKRVMSELKHLPQTKKMFDVVIDIHASSYSSINDIECSIAAKVGMSASSTEKFHYHMKDSNFLILLEDINDRIELYKVGTKWWNLKRLQAIVSTSTFQKVYQRMAVDLEIRLDDHLLSWELFCMNVGEVLLSTCIQRQAVNVVKACCGHLLAIVLMARALKEVEDVRIWKDASHALGLQTPYQMEDKVLFNALAFIWERSGSAKSFIEYCALSMETEGIGKVHLIQRWIADTLIGTADEGEKIVGDLVNAFLLERLQNGEFVRMRDEIREVLLRMLRSETDPTFLRLGGGELTKPPNDEAWKEARWMDLSNNKLSELPDTPNCPQLRELSLQINPYLREIPPSFFERMHALQILNLSYTRINTLPPSLFKLGLLRDFFLRGCELLMQLPPEVGELKNLEVLNLEGTEILNLPMEVGKLMNLKCLIVSFYGYNQQDRKSGQSNTMVPQNVISNLVQLVELSMDVNPDDERWNVTVKHIVKEVCGLKQLKALKLYLPEVILLEEFIRDGTSSSTYLSLVQFRFIVGSYLKRIISRSPHEAAAKFEQQGRHLKYVNGENVPDDFKNALQHATALFVDRHSTVTSLSQFGIENMKKLEFCVLGECNEIQTVIDGAEICNRGDNKDVNGESVLGSLWYLCIYYMKSLSSILKGPILTDCLSSLKSLALHTCPQLVTIFNLDLLQNLNTLEELVVEDCPEIISLVNRGAHENLPSANFKWYLPRLKRISLHYMPKLVSISSGFRIAPKLEWMSFYGCWSLETLPIDEVSVNDLKLIIGDADWWSALKLTTSNSGFSQPHNLDSIFVPIQRNRDLTIQVAEIVTQHKALRQDTKPPQQQGSSDSLKATAVHAGTTSEEKQLYHPTPSLPPLPASYTNDHIK